MGVTVTPGMEELAVSWTAVADADGYRLQWKSGSESYDPVTRATRLTGGSSTSHTIVGLAAGTAYTVRVVATRTGAADGAPSAEVIGTPLPAALGQPCPGVLVWADPPERLDSVTTTELLIEWPNGVDGGVDWIGPYYAAEPHPEYRGSSTLHVLEVNLAGWSVETTSAATRHTLVIEWPPFLESGLRFWSREANCAFPVLACSDASCVLRP